MPHLQIGGVLLGLVDNGDGTYALKVHGSGGGGSSISQSGGSVAVQPDGSVLVVSVGGPISVRADAGNDAFFSLEDSDGLGVATVGVVAPDLFLGATHGGVAASGADGRDQGVGGETGYPVTLTGGAGGDGTSGDANGGNGGDVTLTPGAKGLKHAGGSGSDGRIGLIRLVNAAGDAVIVPSGDPGVKGAVYHVAGALMVSL